MRMLRIAWIVMGVLLAEVSCFAEGSDEIRQAMRMAVADARQVMEVSCLKELGPISLLPLKGDQNGYLEGLLKNSISEAGLTYVEGKEDPLWNDILQEVEWSERKSDILDQVTLVKFGKLKATKVLLYGALREASVQGQRVFVEIELHASSVETKQHVWGGTFAKRFYTPGSVEGILSAEQLPPELRDVLKKGFLEQATDSLSKAQTKLKPIRSVSVIPLAGDMDQYISGLARDMATQFKDLTVKNLDATTLAEARTILRDPAHGADAILYGAVRDVSQRLVREWPMSKIYEVTTETQLYIESASNEILWSTTISAKGEYSRSVTVWTWITQHEKSATWLVGLIVTGLILTVVAQKARRVR